MCLLELHYLHVYSITSFKFNNYYICVLWSFWGHDVLRDMLKTFSYFNTWGTNLARVFYVHLIQHNHCCRVSMVDSCVSDDVSICANMLEYSFVKIYFDISQNLSTNILSNMDGVYFEYSFLHLFTCSQNSNPFWNIKDSFLRIQFHFFFQFFYDSS